jgi:hypothetical protein
VGWVTRRWQIALGTVAALWSVGSVAFAQSSPASEGPAPKEQSSATPEVRADAEGQPGQLSEADGLAKIVVHPGWAEVVVRRHWLNSADQPEDVVTPIFVPATAAVTSLAVSSGTDDPWRYGQALGLAQAVRRFEAGGRGGGGSRSAAMVWKDPGVEVTRLALSPIAPGAGRRVEYRFLVPTTYTGGRHRVHVPSLAPHLRVVAPPPPQGRLFFEDLPVERAMARDGSLGPGGLSLAPDQVEPLAGAMAVLPLEGDRRLLRYRFDLAATLGESPRRVHAVILFDRSRSRSDNDVEVDRQRIVEYLDALDDDARAEIVVFDREAHSSFGRFVPRDAAREVAESLSLERRHGSHVDRALAVAAERFAEVPDGAERRLLVLTDTRMRSAFTEEALIDGLGDVLTHVVVTGTRFSMGAEEHPWFEVVGRTGGLLWLGGHSITSDEPTVRRLRPAMARLVRPRRLLDPEVIHPGIEESLRHPRDLEAGEGIEELRIVERPIPWVELRGRLWSRPVRLRLRPDPQAGRRWAAIALRARLELTDRERLMLALHGGALSEQTNLVVSGAGQWTEPSPSSRTAHPTFGHHRSRRPPRVRMSRPGTPGPSPDARKEVRRIIALAARACGLRPGDATGARVHLETTQLEIVDVEVTGLAETTSHCVTEALWRHDLPESLAIYWRESWTEDLAAEAGG